MRLFLDAHFRQAVAEAFLQVELAVQEKSGNSFTGRTLIQHAFRSKSGPRLSLHHSEKATKAAKEFFEGAFSYYRNHAVHVGIGIDEGVCTRALMVASELLDLLQVSEIQFSTVSDLEKIAIGRGFSSIGSLFELLHSLDGRLLVDDCVDGLFEEFGGRGWGEEEFDFVFEAGLVRYESRQFSPEEQREDNACSIGEFSLSERAVRFLNNETA